MVSKGISVEENDLDFVSLVFHYYRIVIITITIPHHYLALCLVEVQGVDTAIQSPVSS